MYVVIVLAQTVVLPILSALLELLVQGGDPILVVGRWFLFWGVGTRLLLAGVHQILRPGFTLGIVSGQPNAEAEQVVQELGFSNVVVGAVAIVATFVSSWAVPASIIGGAFLGLAGIRHVAKPALQRDELVATWTDLVVGAVMLVYVVRLLIG